MDTKKLLATATVLLLGIASVLLLMQTTSASAGKGTPPSSSVKPPSAKKYDGIKVCKETVHDGCFSDGLCSATDPERSFARKLAIARWARNVSESFGSKWATWDIAVDKNINCHEDDCAVGYHSCDVSARPCKFKEFKKQQ